jgi:hypothetical protein
MDFQVQGYQALEDYLLGYDGVTVRELVQYIIHTYSRTDPTQLADCYTNMTHPTISRTLLKLCSPKLMTASDTHWRGGSLRRSPVCKHCVLADPGHSESPVGMC